LNKALELHAAVKTYSQRVESVKNLIERPLVKLQQSEKRSNSLRASEVPAAIPLFRYRASFEKGEEAKYLSHLDLTRALPRAFRRAKIKLGYSLGYHPMPLIQYGPALGVGTVGCNELLDFDSPDKLDTREFLDRINSVLPPGFRFKSLIPLPAGAKSLIKEINRAEYSIPLDAEEIDAAVSRVRIAPQDGADIHQQLIEAFLNRDSCVIERIRRDKKQIVDVRRYTKRLDLEVKDRRSLRVVIEITANGGAKPIEVIAAVYRLSEPEMVSLSSRVRRLRLYFEPEFGHKVSDAHQIAAQLSEQGETPRVTVVTQ